MVAEKRSTNRTARQRCQQPAPAPGAHTIEEHRHQDEAGERERAGRGQRLAERCEVHTAEEEEEQDDAASAPARSRPRSLVTDRPRSVTNSSFSDT